MSSKTAYFVVGPESSGTRMITKALIGVGVWGSSDHHQELDGRKFSGRPDKIVFRRSLPHARTWPDLSDIIKEMEDAGYEVIVLWTFRHPKFMALSQHRAGHVENLEQAYHNIQRAVEYFRRHLLNRTTVPILYGLFVNCEQERIKIFSQLGLTLPNMEFYDGNVKYYQSLG